MNRHRVALIIRLIIWILILSQLTTIVLMKTVGYGFSEAFHEVNGLLIGVLLIVCVILDWTWIKKNMFKF
jgi:Na+-translocating ferredoxin:NAD+ oxidoreductase RnfE subunit